MAEESTSSEAPRAPALQSSGSRMMRNGKQALDIAVTRMRGGLREAERRLDDEQKDWEARAEQAKLPDIGPADPIADLAIRVDRESDYWRAFAVRNMRPGAARNLAIGGAALALSSGLAAGTLATLAAVLGADGPAVASMETAAGVALCAVVAAVLGVVSERGRNMAAHEALARADHAERRLERIAAILALRGANEPKYIEALSRLERDR